MPATLRAALLPANVDLSLVGSAAAIGAVVFGLAARIARDFGIDVDVERAAVEGAFWGGLVGVAILGWAQAEAS